MSTQPVELILRNTIERVDILVVDVDGNPVDATGLTLRVIDMSDTVILQDDYFNGYGATPTPPTRIVKPIGTVGQYYFPFGDTSFDAKNTTANLGDHLFQWGIIAGAGVEQVNIIQVAKVVTAQTMSWLPYLRAQIDKAGKASDDDPTNPCLVGYTDSQLMMWLELGLTAINAAQPYPVWQHLHDFPFTSFGQLLIDSAMITGLTSQAVFAIDTDIDAYSDQGNSFSILHYPKLLGMLQFLAAKLDKAVPAMKLHFVNSGSIYLQRGPNYRLASLMQAAPGGALFRNLLIAG